MIEEWTYYADPSRSSPTGLDDGKQSKREQSRALHLAEVFPRDLPI